MPRQQFYRCWLATGDIAECDADGYYYITAEENLIVSSNGKKIYPRGSRMLKKEPASSGTGD